MRTFDDMSDTQRFEVLASEKASLDYGTRLHWFHWAIVILSAVLTIGAWHFSKTQIEDQNRQRFERESRQVIELVSERMRKYEDTLWSGVAAIQANSVATRDNTPKMNHAEWHRFARSLDIESKYPGINGIGVILNIGREGLAAHEAGQRQYRDNYSVRPLHANPDILPIVFIEPEDTNAKAVGLDMAHETGRYEAAKAARDSGLSQITAPIVLVQDAAKTPGFLFYAPYYTGGTYETVSQRRDYFAGMVYAPFVVNKLLAGTLEKDKRHVGIRLTDGSNVLFDEHVASEADYDPDPMYTSVTRVDAYGRTWTFDIWSALSFRAAANNNQPTFILAGGITIDVLLLTLFILLTRSNKRTLSFADRMTAELREKAAQLAKSNSELESFAYVTSHDLKTPLRGIADLTTYLEEDLENYCDMPNSNTDVKHNLGRLHQQVERMDSLIRGILDYSGVGLRTEPLEPVLVTDIVNALCEDIGINQDQVIIKGQMPALVTYRVRFEQVLANLIGNAFKYHHDCANASVSIACLERENFYSFSITDNGPGIDPKFHGRIFEVFQTLQSKDEIESSGVGLSIVKKSVEGLGGQVSVTSELGNGTTFRFDWPKITEAPIVDQKEAV